MKHLLLASALRRSRAGGRPLERPLGRRLLLGGFACLATLVWSAALFAQAAERHPVGHSELRVIEPAGKRPLAVHLWYPAEGTGDAKVLGNTGALRGFEAIPEGTRAPGRFPLALLSHGVEGSWRNLGWLAARLAAGGMIAAAPTHPETAELWERPEDLRRILARLLADPAWRPAIDPARVAAIGHSLGGYTVLALAGAHFDPARFERYCAEKPDRWDCTWPRDKGVGRTAAARDKLRQDLRDPRLRAVIALDSALGQALDPRSLAQVALPVLVLGGAENLPILPIAEGSRHIAALLPVATTTYREVPDAGHFSFLAECKARAIAVLQAEGRGEEIICRDGGRRDDRQSLHLLFLQEIRRFLGKAGF